MSPNTSLETDDLARSSTPYSQQSKSRSNTLLARSGTGLGTSSRSGVTNWATPRELSRSFSDGDVPARQESIDGDDMRAMPDNETSMVS
jgi:hypothetical protein